MAEAPKTFEAVVVTDRRGRACLDVPFDPDAAWGVKARHRVGGSIDGKKVRGVIEPADGAWRFILTPMWMRDCGVAVGDRVKAALHAEGPQRGQLDPDIAAALDAEPPAAAAFDELAQFYRKAFLTWIGGTKSRPEERARRIAEMVTLLKAGKKQRPKP
jgi:hypothetical protein